MHLSSHASLLLLLLDHVLLTQLTFDVVTSNIFVFSVVSSVPSTASTAA